MITKKRLALIAVLPLTVAVTLGVLAMLPPGPGVTKANFDRIEKGMTLAEVEQIFGEKGEPSLLNTVKDKKLVFLQVFGEKGEAPAGTWMEWDADDGSGATILFEDGADGHIIRMRWYNSHEHLVQKIGRWLHLRGRVVGKV
jgi:hypothetical protein